MVIRVGLCIRQTAVTVSHTAERVSSPEARRARPCVVVRWGVVSSGAGSRGRDSSERATLQTPIHCEINALF